VKETEVTRPLSNDLFRASTVRGGFDVGQKAIDDIDRRKPFALGFEVGHDAVTQHRWGDSRVPSVQAGYQNSSWKGCAKSES
jgi:hypothetical protein